MKRYRVRVLTRAKTNEVMVLSGGYLKIKVTAPKSEGRANQALLSLLADYFRVSTSQIVILSGELSKDKVVGILND